jgi:hypothetical protein
MVTTTKLSASIAKDLRAVRGRISALRRIERRLTSAESPYTADQRAIEHADLEVEWRDIMDRLDWLHQRYTADSMSAEQGAEYQQLVELIPDALPIITRLRLEPPPTAVLTHLALGQAARPSSARAR